MAVKEPAQPFWCHIPRLAAYHPRLLREREFLIRNHDDTHQSTRIGCLHERRSYSRAHTTPGSNVDTPIAGDTTRSRMASQKFYLWAPKGISSSVVTHAPSPPGRMRLTSRQSISPWRVARRVFRHAASSKRRPPQTAGGIAAALAAPRSRTRRRSSPRGRPRVATP